MEQEIVRHSSVPAYAKAAAVSVVAIGLQLLLDPYTTPASYQLLVAAVAVSAMRWGLNRGLFALFICGIAKLYIFLLPRWSWTMDAPTAVRWVLFLAVGCLVAWMGGRLHTVARTLASTLSSIADAVIATDVNDRVVFLNPAAQTLSGCAPNDAWGRKLSDVLCFADGEHHESLARQVIEAGAPVERISRVLVCADGSHLPVEISGAPICGAEGQVLGVIFVSRAK